MKFYFQICAPQSTVHPLSAVCSCCKVYRGVVWGIFLCDKQVALTLVRALLFTDGKALTDSKQKTTLHAIHLSLSVSPPNWGSHTVHSCTCGPHKSLWECACMWERVCYCAPSKTQKGINPFNLTKALLSMHYLTSVLLQITTVFVPLSFLEEIPEEWVLHSIELKGRRDIWPLEMLQECQRDILIFFLFCLYKLKKILPLCAAAVSEVSKAESLFLTMSTEL